ncbi:MAG: flagellar basal body P-ring protein FlgI [Planctomycetota bacterium]
MSLLLTASLALAPLAAPQDDAPPATADPLPAAPVDATPVGPDVTPDVTPRPILPLTGGIEAPRQPVGRSTATYRKTARIRPVSRTGGDYESRVLSPVRSLVGVRGMEDNQLIGIGIVTGLDGTGDSGALATQLMSNRLLAQNINIDPALLATANVAVVQVEANVPPGTKPGQRIDVRVSSIGDAESLYGGVLGITELTDLTGRVVYATASGPVTVSGFQAAGSAAGARKNHVTVGTLASGGTVQQEIPTSVLSEHGFIYLDAKNGQGTFGNTVRIANAINTLYPETADVLPDGRTVRLTVLDGVPDTQVVRYLDRALELEIETDNLARVVINERSGVIVMGGNVRLRPGVIQHGSIVVTIAETPEVSQPGAFSNGTTQRVPRTTLDVVEGDAPLVLVGGATKLEEVVEVLNVLGATPRDMIAILESLVSGGLLIAELRRM